MDIVCIDFILITKEIFRKLLRHKVKQLNEMDPSRKNTEKPNRYLC